MALQTGNGAKPPQLSDLRRGSSGRYTSTSLPPGERVRPQAPKGGAAGLSSFVVQRTNIPLEEGISAGRLTGPVQAFKAILQHWQIPPEKAHVLLGYEEQDRDYVKNVLTGVATLRGRDPKDRIALLFHISATLAALFRDPKTENEWLRTDQQPLNGRSPLSLLQDGAMEQVILLREYVDQLAGR